MRLERQREILRTIFDLAAGDTTQLAEAPLRLASADFTSDETFAHEKQRLFRARPVVACLSCDLREVGDYVALESGGIPLVVVRLPDGSAAAYVNICRHRGAPLVASGVGETARAFRCGFHGWVYDLEGRNVGRPHSVGGFDSLDAACTSLVSRPVAEAYGFVFVRPEGDSPIDVDVLLGGMGDELADFGFGSYHRFGTDVAEWDANWKLLVDTFLETYHVPTLHPTTVGRHFLSRPSLCAAFGANIRFHSLMKSVLALRDQPEDEWVLLPHGTVEYAITPNTVVNFSVDHVAIYQFTPLAPGRTRSLITIYTPSAVTDDVEKAHFERTLALHRRVSGGEDFTRQEHIQRALASAAMPEVVFGRNEPATIMFHTALHALLAEER